MTGVKSCALPFSLGLPPPPPRGSPTTTTTTSIYLRKTECIRVCLGVEAALPYWLGLGRGVRAFVHDNTNYGGPTQPVSFQLRVLKIFSWGKFFTTCTNNKLTQLLWSCFVNPRGNAKRITQNDPGCQQVAKNTRRCHCVLNMCFKGKP